MMFSKPNGTTFPRFYFYTGGKEDETEGDDVKKMYDLIAQKHNYDMREVVYPLGQHNESYWRKEFSEFLFMADEINS